MVLRHSGRSNNSFHASTSRSDILAAHEKDQAMFYRLLQRKHGPYENSVALCIDVELNFNADEQRVGWAQFYKDLATAAPDSGNKPILDCIRSTNSEDIL